MLESAAVCASHSPGMDRDTDARLGQGFRKAIADARRRVAAFAPDLLVLFGGDHRRAFNRIVPAFSIVHSASTIEEGAALPAAELTVPGDLALAVTAHLLNEDYDVALCRDVALDHAFSQPLRDLAGEVDCPVLPVPINCASPPLPRPERVLTFSRTLRRALATEGVGRVLAIGTGGLSHSPPSLETDRHDLSEQERREIIDAGKGAARDRIVPSWDRGFLDALSRWDEPELLERCRSATEQAGVGANEVRTWLAAGAFAGRGLETLVYEPVPEWITGMGVSMSPEAA